MPGRKAPRILVAAALFAAAGAAHASRSPDERNHRGGRDSGRHDRDRHAAPARELPAVTMTHLTTHERFVLRPDHEGHLGGKRLRGLRHFLRCHHTGREHPMSTRLAELLYATSRHFGFKDITVVAGYRAPRIARSKGNPRSPHKQGVACDFRLDGIPIADIRDYARAAFRGVGVGYYPNSHFVHLDVGRKANAFWIDYSGPGERARYARDPDEDLRAEDADEDESSRPAAPVAAPPVATPEAPPSDEEVPAARPGVARGAAAPAPRD